MATGLAGLLTAWVAVASLDAAAPAPSDAAGIDGGFAVVTVEIGLGAVQLPDPQRYPVWGLDVSHHQHRIDWSQVAQQPRMKFAFMKATQGTTLTDPLFARNWSGARGAGLKVGAYHYFSFCSDAAAQADLFLSVVPPAREALPAVLDVEYGNNCAPNANPAVVRRQLRTWLARVERATHRRPMIYATSDILADYILGSDLDYPLWVRCTAEDPEPVVGLPWSFIQYEDQQAIPGIEGEVDHDLFAGDVKAWEELLAPPRRRPLKR